MKTKSLLHLLGLCAALFSTLPSAQAQGFVRFNNRVPGAVVAPIYGTNSINATLAKTGLAVTNGGTQDYTGHPLLVATIYTAQLWAGPLGQIDAGLTLVSSTVFGTNTLKGFIVAPTSAVAIASVPAGTQAWVRVRAWDNLGGTVTTWAAAQTNPAVASGESPGFAVGPLGSNTTNAPNLTNLVSFNIHLPCSPPDITCPANITTNIAGSSVVVNYANPIVSGGALVGCMPASGSTFALGTNLVTCLATNGCGSSNICSFNVTVTLAPALEKIWSGLGTNNNWTTGSNWSAAVVVGDSLFFAGSTRLLNNNDFPAGTAFSNLTFKNGSGPFVITGNWCTVTGNITNNQAGGTETIGFDLVPATTAYMDVVSNGFLNITGAISGPFGLTKTGLGRLTLSGANTFTGAVAVAAGTLRVNHDSALGVTNGTTTISSGATLDVGAPTTGVNGLDLGTEQIFISGSGVDGAGAIVSTFNNSQQNALQMVTLMGDTTFGGTGPWTFSGGNPNRWDIRGTPTTAFLSTGGQPYNLTKTGSNEVRLAGVTVDPALGNIDIQQGALAFEGNITSLGDPTGTVTVHPGATLEFLDVTNRMNKIFIMIGNGVTASVDTRSGINTILGPVTLSNDCVFIVRGNGTTLTNRGPIGGSGGLIKAGGATGVSRLVLAGTNTYTGNTLVSVNTLALVGSGSISSSPTITVASGAILDASGRTDRTLTVASGQTLTGDGSVLGRVTISAGATLAPCCLGTNGEDGVLIVNSNLTLAGLASMEINCTNVRTSTSVTGITTVAYGGTLMVSNLGPDLQAGDCFTLFSATNYTGSFTTMNLPALGAGLAWNTSTLVQNGSLCVVALPLDITCPGNITTNIVGTEAVVNYPNPTVINGMLTGCTPPGGSVFPLGTTPVTCTATNGFASNSCAFSVMVHPPATELRITYLGGPGAFSFDGTGTTMSSDSNLTTVSAVYMNGVSVNDPVVGERVSLMDMFSEDPRTNAFRIIYGSWQYLCCNPPLENHFVLYGATMVTGGRLRYDAASNSQIFTNHGNSTPFTVAVQSALAQGRRFAQRADVNLADGSGTVEVYELPLPNTNCLSFAGFEHCSVGNAQLTIVDTNLVVSNLGSSGSDGVAINCGQAAEFVWTVDLLNPPLGAQFVTRYFGLVNGVANSPLGSSTMTSVSTGAQILPDFTGLGSSTYKLQLLLNNVIVYTESGKSGIAMVVGGAAARGRVCWFGTGICSYHFGITAASEPHDVFVTGGPCITADMFIITPESQRDLGGYVSRCEATATLIPTFVILDEAVPAPPVITCPANIITNILGSSVVVNYPSPTVSNGSLLGCTTASGSMFSLGTTVITCTATNAYGQKTCTFNVTAQYITPPRITDQPRNRTAAPGNDVNFNVTATGTSPLRFKWLYRQNTNVAPPVEVPFATNATLTLINMQATNAGDYLVVVSNPSGSVTSSPAILTMLPGPSRLRANPDLLWAVTDKPLTLHDAALTANDTNAYALLVTLTNVNPVTSHGGTVTRNGQTFTYRSASGFAGTDTFTYSISDGTTTSVAVATVEVSRSEGRGNITSIVHRDSSNEITFNGIPNRLYSLRKAASLPNNSTSLWQHVAFVATGSNGIFSYLDAGPPDAKAFYNVCDPCFPCSTDEATVEQLFDPSVEVVLSPVGFVAHRVFKIQNASIVEAGGNVPTDTYAISKVDSLGAENPVPVPYFIEANGDITIDFNNWPDGKYYFSLESTVIPCQEEEGQGDEESDYDVVEIELAAPSADFSCTQKYPCDPFNIQFNVIDPDFSNTYTWHIFDEDGDELPIGSATGPALCFTFPYISIAPHFKVCLDVVNFLGQTNCHCKVVTVSTDPDPSFTYSYEACHNEPLFSVVFENTSKPAGCLAATYKWTFGNNIAPPTSTALSPTHSYASGVYSVMLEMTLNGVTKSVTKLINVHADAIHATATVCVDGGIIYRTLNGNPPHWVFNDGDAEIHTSIEHAQKVKYTLVGTKNTTLSFTNADFGFCTTNLMPVISSIIECCKKDHQIDYFYFDSGNYRLKTTWKCRGNGFLNTGFPRGITAKTRVAKYSGGIYWSAFPFIKRKDVQSIDVSFTGQLWFKDLTTDCDCTTPSPINESKSHSKKRHVTKRVTYNGEFRIRSSSIGATHSVNLKNGPTATVSHLHFGVCND